MVEQRKARWLVCVRTGQFSAAIEATTQSYYRAPLSPNSGNLELQILTLGFT